MSLLLSWKSCYSVDRRTELPAWASRNLRLLYTAGNWICLHSRRRGKRRVCALFLCATLCSTCPTHVSPFWHLPGAFGTLCVLNVSLLWHPLRHLTLLSNLQFTHLMWRPHVVLLESQIDSLQHRSRVELRDEPQRLCSKQIFVGQWKQQSQFIYQFLYTRATFKEENLQDLYRNMLQKFCLRIIVSAFLPIHHLTPGRTSHLQKITNFILKIHCITTVYSFILRTYIDYCQIV